MGDKGEGRIKGCFKVSNLVDCDIGGIIDRIMRMRKRTVSWSDNGGN